MMIWGEGQYGQLGIARKFKEFVPHPRTVTFFKAKVIIAISCGGFHTACITCKTHSALFHFGFVSGVISLSR